MGREGGRQRESEKGGAEGRLPERWGGGESEVGGAGNPLEEELGRGLEGGVSLPGEALRGRGDGFEVGFWGEEAKAISCLQQRPSSEGLPHQLPNSDTHLRPSAGSYFTSSCSDSWRAQEMKFPLPTPVFHSPPSPQRID